MDKAGLAHLGIGMAAKRVAPGVPGRSGPVVSWAIHVSGLVDRRCVDRLADQRQYTTSLIIGLLVFSHWVVDFVAKPMTHAFPIDVGVPLFFDGSQVVGLGAWGTAAGEYIGEYGTTALGLAIYALTVMSIRKERGGSARPHLPCKPVAS